MAADESQKKYVIAEARKEGKTVHFASLMDICHLKKGRIALRGEIVKDDSGFQHAQDKQPMQYQVKPSQNLRIFLHH